MNKLKAIAAASLTGVVLLVSSGAALAATEPPAYGVCVSEKTGSVRVLEKTNLARSIYGACGSTETKVSLSSKVTLPAAQKSLRDQWAADKAEKLPAKPTATDVEYQSWLNADPTANVTRVVYTIPDVNDNDGDVVPDSYLCTSLRHGKVVKVGNRNVRVPNYSCVSISDK